MNSRTDREVGGAILAEEQVHRRQERENIVQVGWFHTVRKLNTELKNYNSFVKQWREAQHSIHLAIIKKVKINGKKYVTHKI